MAAKNGGDSKKISDILFNSEETVTEDNMYLLYKKANVIREYVEVYNQFSKSLMYVLHNTYLGNEYIKTPLDIEGHFQWCFNKICNKFKETLNFKNIHKNKELHEYFFEHAKVHIYNNNKYSEDELEFDIDYIDDIMNFYNLKPEEDLKTMIELYYKFNKKIF